MDHETLRFFRSQLDIAKGRLEELDRTAKHVEDTGMAADANWATRIEARVHQCEAVLSPIVAFVERLIDDELARPN